MGLWLIGLDEAGLAPNLGPLVIAATLWELPEDCTHSDLWQKFEGVLSQNPRRGSNVLHVADSKQVHQSNKGVRALERGVYSALHVTQQIPSHEIPGSLESLWKLLSPEAHSDYLAEPWNLDAETPLPHEVPAEELRFHVDRWRARSDATGIRLHRICADIVSTSRFNRLVEQYQNKGHVLSTLVFALLRKIWNPCSDQKVLIVGDKHGGRNRYDDLIREVAQDQFVLRCEESRLRSTYRVRNTELRFQVGGEEHLPVALASMVAKYVREVSLIPFNRYWCSRVPDLQPTKGYPQDALRFRNQVDSVRTQLGITDHQFWRSR